MPINYDGNNKPFNAKQKKKKLNTKTIKHSQTTGIRKQDKMKAFCHLWCTIKEPEWLTWLQKLPFLLHKLTKLPIQSNI